MKSRSIPHWIVQKDEHGVRLDHYLAAPERTGSRGRAITALTRGKVFVNDKEASPKDAGSRLQRGDKVRVWMDRPGSARRRRESRIGDLHVLYEDETLLVVNKPAGLLAVPLRARADAPSAYDLVARHLGRHSGRDPFIVHRIDRDTSGLVVFAKTARAQQVLKEQFSRREPERVYLAIVEGHPTPAIGTWRDRLMWDSRARKQRTSTHNSSGVEAVSDYRVIDTFADASLIEVRLRTGKRNQIRIQAARRGHALIGERQYISAAHARTHELARQALHAHRLGFQHPIDGRPLSFVAPLPADLLHLLAQLKRA